MPGFLLHVNALVQCTHAAPATIIPSQPRVLVSGQPVERLYREIRPLRIYEGATEVQQLIIARGIIKTHQERERKRG